MDIHRCRFVDYPPTAINALAFSQSYDIPGKKYHPLRLAVGRANGNIEIWDPQGGNWAHEITLYGGQGRSIDGLAWVRDPDEKDEETGRVIPGRLRLFSIGYASEITEWDLTTGLPLQTSTGSHSEIWCLAAQPAWDLNEKGLVRSPAEQKTQDLVVGCDDGSLAQFSTADGELSFKRFIARASSKKARAISITFQGRDRVVAGYSNSVIRVYDLKNLQMVRSIHVGGSNRAGPKDSLVWSLECLCDGTLVSGDSTGEVAFWDAKNFGQLAKFKSHESDVLCLASSHDGKTIFSGGMDRRTCVYTSNATEFGQRFKLKQHRRLHQHDVKAISRYDGAKVSMLVSGGADGSPIVVPLHSYESEYHRKLPFTPQTPPVAGSNRFVVSWWENQVGVWSISPRNKQGVVTDDASYKELLRMSLKSEEHITSADVSASGRLLAVSTIGSTKLFALTAENRDGRTLRASKIETPAALSSTGARITQLSSDAKWLLTIESCERVRVHRIAEETEGKFTVVKQVNILSRQPSGDTSLDWLNGTWGSYRRTITRAAFSADSNRVAVSDISGQVHSWALKGAEDLSKEPAQIVSQRQATAEESESEDEDDDVSVAFYGQTWTQAAQLPRLDSMPLVLCFHQSEGKASKLNGNHASIPVSDDRLVVLTSAHGLYEFHTASGSFTQWSRNNPTSSLPDEFKIQKERVIGGFVEAERERLWLYSATWLCMISLKQDLVASAYQETNGSEEHDQISTAKKRKRTSSFTAGLERPDAKRIVESRKKNDGAAGDRIRDAELLGGVAERGYRKLDQNGESEFIKNKPRPKVAPVEEEQIDDDEDDDDEEEEEEDEEGEMFGSEDEADGALVTTTRRRKDRPPKDAFYITLRYRPILGVVPLRKTSIPGTNGHGADEALGESSQDVLEVALIERPMHDIDLGPRHVGNQKWED